MDIVRGLEIQYLWIDSLCILQDSTRSWNLNARAMDLRYGHAKLKICAADGKDLSANLKAVYVNEYDHHQYIKDYVTEVRLIISRSLETDIKAFNVRQTRVNVTRTSSFPALSHHSTISNHHIIPHTLRRTSRRNDTVKMFLNTFRPFKTHRPARTK